MTLWLWKGYSYSLSMFYVGLLILLGAGAYAVSQGAVSQGATRPREPIRTDRHFRIEGTNLTVADGDILHYYPLADLDYLALHTRSGPYRLELEFAGERVSASEAEPGVESMLGELVRDLTIKAPRGLDLSRYGEALESRSRRRYILLDSRPRP